MRRQTISSEFVSLDVDTTTRLELTNDNQTAHREISAARTRRIKVERDRIIERGSSPRVTEIFNLQ